MNPSQVVEEDWFALDLESKLNKKIDTLQTLVHQQNDLIQHLSGEIKQMKHELDTTHHRSPCEHLSSQNDRTHQLLEELKVIKQRELNMMLREKIPVPFSFPTILSNLKLKNVVANVVTNAGAKSVGM